MDELYHKTRPLVIHIYTQSSVGKKKIQTSMKTCQNRLLDLILYHVDHVCEKLKNQDDTTSFGILSMMIVHGRAKIHQQKSGTVV